MCGIFGIVNKEDSKITYSSTKAITDSLFKLSESRGKEAAGLAIRNKKAVYVYKEPVRASQMIHSSKYKQIFSQYANKNPLTIIGHVRLATNGLQNLNSNNQPVIKNNSVGVHNGIIVNVKKLFQQFPVIKREYEVDTEVILNLIQLFNKEDNSLIQATQKTFQHIKGAASIAVLFDSHPHLLLATNTGSLYILTDLKQDTFIFASEKLILKNLIKKQPLKKILKKPKISHLTPGSGYLVNLQNLKIKKFSLNESQDDHLSGNEHVPKMKIIDLSPESPPLPSPAIKKVDLNLLEYNENSNLKKCTKCILPETFPGISFDKDGICNYCKNYQKQKTKGETTLKEFIDKYRSKSDQPDCIVGFSGGRDSSYGLYYIKNVLKMNPLAFTYDWGMVTDLVRRNQARICGELGIEQIIISADIKKKREYIQKNINAWLKRPNLGMIPLFMAGDKQFYYYANQLMKQNDIKLMIFCENEKFEKTKFKSLFCGVDEGNARLYNIPLLKKLKLSSYYIKQYLLNPSYLNTSFFDTAFAYLSTYLIRHDYLYLYKYVDWNEEKINKTLIFQYDWETAPDTKSTWRIGDGTAPFYNYIYYTVAGFTENDTFRSNQIREGVITRQEALEKIKKENQPRAESIKWYCDTIGIDFNKTIKTINSIPKLYKS